MDLKFYDINISNIGSANCPCNQPTVQFASIIVKLCTNQTFPYQLRRGKRNQ